MIDINLIRDNPNIVKQNIKKKFQDHKLEFVDSIKKKDEEWRSLKQTLDSLKHERNKISESINEAKKINNEEEAKKLIKKAKEIPDKISKLQEQENTLEKEIKDLMLQIPNIISKKTPKGKDESKNKVIRKSGKIPKFKFEIKNHVQLVENLNIADFDVSSKVSGNGFYYLKDKLALLNQALIRYVLDFMQKKKYTYIESPLMLNENSIYASMDKEAIENSVYSVKGDDLHLIGTAEQSLLAMHSNETFKEEDLPKKYFSYSMCFRKEIGSHGINEKGLWRTHQFNKIEQFIFSTPKDSETH